MSQTAPFSAQYVNENHILGVSSLCAVGSRIMNETQGEHDSRPGVPAEDVNYVRAVTQCVYMHSLVRLQPYFHYATQSDNCNYPSIHADEKIGSCHTPVR